MIKDNRKEIIICALIMLVPVTAGLVLWNRLPDQMVIHWNANGEADGYAGKAFAIFGLNAILYALYAICLIATNADPKKNNISRKTFLLCIGSMPLISIFANGVTLAAAMGKKMDIAFWYTALISILFIIIGNYMPKMRQSYTIGIKLPWTLESADNWNRTHRFASKIMLIFGLILLANAFIKFMPLAVEGILFAVVILAPVVYSYLYYVRNHDASKGEETDE